MKNIDSMKGMQEKLNISIKPPGRLSNRPKLEARAVARERLHGIAMALSSGIQESMF